MGSPAMERHFSPRGEVGEKCRGEVVRRGEVCSDDVLASSFSLGVQWGAVLP